VTDRPARVAARAGIALAVVAAGCATPFDQLREQAADAFQCSATKDLVVTRLDDLTWKVEGCGNEATYIRVCSHGPGKIHCTWGQITIKYPNPNE